MNVGDHRFVYFRIADSSGNPVAGLTKASFTIIFTRDNLACLDTLTITDLTGGLYSADYHPGVAGTDYLDIYEATNKVRSVSTEQIQGENQIVTLTDAFDSGTIKPAANLNPQNYTLYIYLSSDWQNGNRTAAFSKGRTGLNPNGTWQVPVYVLHGTYAVVLVNAVETIVLASNLQV